MTLVGIQDENLNDLSMMLSVQQQQQHHGLLTASSSSQTHRGNVIVSTSSVPSSDLKMHGCKRPKIYAQATPYGTVPHQPASVARRNARERNRVKQVNNGFATLRQHIPQSVAQALGGNTAGTGGSRAGSKKLSKVETLRMAVEYIRSLQRLLDENDGSEATSTTSCSQSDLASESGHHSAELRLSGDVHSHNSEPHHHHHHHHLRQNPSPGFAPPPCSEASSSPTPSFVSEASSAGSQGYGTTSGGVLYTSHPDNYDNYEPMSPEDEELLDVISWWQQSQ